ncbi:acyltransferase family protein [Glutamicibacter arilaitensis]|uniref:acyltransferase family protein n=1 Tax=Glutamicibacter arilaitensis TaxID=256701 RepID=UPI003850FE9E
MSPAIPSPRSTVQRAEFRADLQGLRALAVLLVMCYHIWFQRVSGGVDIFLMLSAFFLTGSLVRKLQAGDKPSLLGNWLHRFSRLLPQAALIIVATALTAWLVLPGTRWLALIREAFSSLFFTQNWTLATAEVDYYAFNTSAASPLQHFWSLSVQGQIFLLWPLLLIGCALLWRRYFSRQSFALVASIMFAAIFAGSLSYSIYLTEANQRLAYFHTGARLWEFALGSLLALGLPALSRLPEALRRAGGWAGLVVIIGCGALLDVQGQFPGYLALVPTLGAALLVISPGTKRRINPAGWLGAAVLVKLGALSYGMYLWHWPLLVFYLHLAPVDHASPLAGALLIGASIALSWASTRWVEKPLLAVQRAEVLPVLRFLGKPQLVSQALVIVVALSVASVPIAAWESNVEKRRAQAAAQAPEENPGAQAPDAWDPSPAALTLPLRTELDTEWQTPGQSCDTEYTPQDPAILFCNQGGDIWRKPDLVLLGDSHVQHWSEAAARAIEEAGGSWVMIYQPGCRYGSSDNLADPECAAFQPAARDYVEQLAPQMVLTVATHTVPGADAQGRSAGAQETMVEDYADAIEPFVQAGSQVIAMRDTPRYEYSIPECVDRNRAAPEACDAPRGSKLAEANPVDQFLDTHDYGSRVVSLDMSELLCPAGTCKAVIGNVLVYLDDSHLSKTFVNSAADRFAKYFTQATGWNKE